MVVSNNQNDITYNNSQKTKNKALQGLRAIAIIAIFISHSQLGKFEYFGAWGVSAFFVLSGFLMLFNYLQREEYPDFGFGFAWGKIKKLYPLHIITMIFAAIYALITTRKIAKTFLDILIHTLLLQMWIPNKEYFSTLNSPDWYLCVSAFLYLLFPVILKAFKTKMTDKKAILSMCLLFAAEVFISFVAYLLGNHDNSAWFSTRWLTYFSPPVRLIDFLMGCFLGYLYLNKTSLKKNYFLEILVCILIPLSFAIYASEYGVLGSPSVKYTLLHLPTNILLIWVIAKQTGIIPKLLSAKIFVSIGNLSPYIFLIHGVVIKYCGTFFSAVLSIKNRYIVAAISFALTILAAVLWSKITEYYKISKRKNKIKTKENMPTSI